MLRLRVPLRGLSCCVSSCFIWMILSGSPERGAGRTFAHETCLDVPGHDLAVRCEKLICEFERAGIDE